MTTVRAAVHVHSEWSYDAGWSLTSIAGAFARRRYDVVLMSEHERGFDDRRWAEYQGACADASDDGILLVPGLEYEDGDGVVHTIVWGEGIPFLGVRRPTLQLLRGARAENGFAVFAHPWRRDAVSRYRSEWAPLLSAVEVWNRQYDGVAPNPSGPRFAQQENLRPFVSLDFHTRRQFFPLAMSIELEQPPTTAAVADALHAGRFRPDLMGLSALWFSRGLTAATLQAAETTRRGLRGSLRTIERRLRAPSRRRHSP